MGRVNSGRITDGGGVGARLDAVSSRTRTAAVIDYSSIMIGMRQDLLGSRGSVMRSERIAAQENIGTALRYWDPWFGNPLVAGSAPPAPQPTCLTAAQAHI